MHNLPDPPMILCEKSGILHCWQNHQENLVVTEPHYAVCGLVLNLLSQAEVYLWNR